VTLNRPERHNSLDLDDCRALKAGLVRLSALPDLRCIVLNATGKSFCSGVNLMAVDPAHDWRDDPAERLADAIDDFPVPVLCALNGGVYGGGFDFAMACDFRIGITGMTSFVPPARLGIQYPTRGLERAVTRIGLGPAKRLFLAIETFDADMLKAIGFLDWLVAPDELKPRVDAWIEATSALAPLALRGMKRTLNEAAVGRLDRIAADARSVASFRTEDHAEGRRAMAEKRKPAFKGK
jgi:enoyl-CoA hydratase/carnithine racemase